SICLVLLFADTHAHKHWISVGNKGFSQCSACYMSLAAGNSDSLYIGFRDNAHNQKASVMMYVGNQWISVGRPGISNGIARDVVVSIDSKGTPYVSYSDGWTFDLIVKKFDGTNWVTIGSNFSGGYEKTSMVFDSNDTPYLAYVK